MLIEENLEGDGAVNDPVYSEDDDDEILYGEGHETLVVHKTLLTPNDNARDD